MGPNEISAAGFLLEHSSLDSVKIKDCADQRWAKVCPNLKYVMNKKGTGVEIKSKRSLPSRFGARNRSWRHQNTGDAPLEDSLDQQSEPLRSMDFQEAWIGGFFQSDA